MPNLLFVCSKNQWRSPTAESLFKNHRSNIARSAGTSNKARVKVNGALIAWADVIFVMERKHKEILTERFHTELTGKTLITLNIPDNYQFGDPELIEILKRSLAGYLD